MGIWQERDNPLFALFCLEEVPISTIEEIIENAAKRCEMYCYWLADTYESLPEREYEDTVPDKGTVPPIDSTWRSPFIGKTMQQCADFIKNAPSDRGLCKLHFVILDKEQYERDGWVTCCKIMDSKIIDNGEISAIPGDATLSTEFLYGYDDGMWDSYIQDWEEMRTPCIR